MKSADVRQRFRHRPFVIGVVHLAPLPGSPRAVLVEKALGRAESDARALIRAGFDGLLVENFGDAPFFPSAVPPVTVAAMTLACDRVRAVAAGRPVGTNVLRNDAISALGIAVAARLDFIRVNVLSGVAATDQGILTGEAASLMRDRARLGAPVLVFADVLVKHATTFRDQAIPIQVEELVGRALADAVLVTGPATGAPPDLDRLRAVRSAASGRPVIVASGASLENLPTLGLHADGFIVGTSVKRGGVTSAAVDPSRAAAFVRAAHACRGHVERRRSAP